MAAGGNVDGWGLEKTHALGSDVTKLRVSDLPVQGLWQCSCLGMTSHDGQPSKPSPARPSMQYSYISTHSLRGLPLTTTSFPAWKCAKTTKPHAKPKPSNLPTLNSRPSDASDPSSSIPTHDNLRPEPLPKTLDPKLKTRKPHQPHGHLRTCFG